MMSFTWRSRKAVSYESVSWHESQAVPGVRFAVRKVSLASRLELLDKVRELCLQNEFLRAGDLADQGKAAVSDLLVDRLYLEWGVAALEGLEIDGSPATITSLVESGPETLAEEMIERIRFELGLTEDERKNS
jgi:hypothetical protein